MRQMSKNYDEVHAFNLQKDNADRFNIMRGKAVEAFDSNFGKCFGIQYDRFYRYNVEQGILVPDRSKDHR